MVRWESTGSEGFSNDDPESSLLRVPSRSMLQVSESSLLVESSFHSNGLVHQEIKVVGEEKLKTAFKSTKHLVIGLILLVCTVIPNSMIAPLVLALPAKTPFVALSWRAQTTVIFLAPVLALFYTKNKSESFRKDFHPEKLFKSFAVGFLMFGWTVCMVLSCKYTVTSHSDVLFNSTGVFILLFSIITCKLVHKLEVIGYTIFVLG